MFAGTAAKSLQSCPTLCDPIDGSPADFPAPGILQARTLEWVAISFPNAWKGKVKVKSLSPVRLLLTPWTAAYQAPPSMGFSRQEYWSRVPLPSPQQDATQTLFDIPLHMITEEGCLISPCYSLEICIQMDISFFFSFAFHVSSSFSYLYCKASSDNHFAFLHFFFLGTLTGILWL